MLHGTTVDKIDMIAQYGFDQRMARERPVRPGGLLHGPVLQECLWLSVAQNGG